jgi:hypothetical protein
MRVAQLLASLFIVAVLGFVATLCGSILFGTCCGQSIWSSPDADLATKAWLCLGMTGPSVAALLVLYWGVKDPLP